MRQIKTICEKSGRDLDIKVNKELRNGWTLTWRAVQAVNGVIIYFAGMEADVIVEKGCETCQHRSRRGCEPCIYCNDAFNKWEAAE